MSSRSAPGVIIIERDFSDYTAADSQTAVALLGTAKRGPLNVATLITSPEQFLDVFGEPSANHYAAFSALNYLKFGNVLWFVRVAKRYEAGAGLLASLGAPDGNGRIYEFDVEVGHDLSVNDYLRITQTGKATTQNVKVTAITGQTITVDAPLIDVYDTSDTSDSTIDRALSAGAAASAEVFGLTRKGGSIDRVVKFTAKDPGEYANFGTRAGIEVVIQDGGQFSNVNPSTALPYESDEGVPLQGIMPSAPSVDTKADLLKLTSSNGGVRVGETRGVNYDLATTLILSVEAAGGSSSSSGSVEAVLTVASTAGFAAGQSIAIDGSPSYDGAYEVAEVLSSTEIQVNNFPEITETEPADGEYWSLENQDSPKLAVVYRCTDNDADAALGYSTWVAQGVLTKRVVVLYQGRQVETFDNLIGYDTGSGFYWDTVIGSPNTTIQNSAYIHAEYLGEGQQPLSTYDRIKFPYNPRLLLGSDTSCKTSATSGSGSTLLHNARGYNGNDPLSADYIGTVNDDGTKTGLQLFTSKEAYQIDILAIPGISYAAVLQAMITVLETRNDCLGVFDPPFRLSPQEIINWHNGTGPYSGYHAAFVSNKAALYYGWVRAYDAYSATELWLPPSCFVPAIFAYSDSVGEAHFAAAGYQRGRVPGAIAVERIIEESDVETFYGPANGNAINPIMTFAQDGIMVYGNRTLQRHASALDRINVRRLLFGIERHVARSTRRLAFEQNDPIVWSQVTGVIEPYLQDLKGKRALEDYLVKCDDKTNTPSRRNQNEILAKVYLIPVKSGERLELNFSILPSGVTLDVQVAQDNQ